MIIENGIDHLGKYAVYAPCEPRCGHCKRTYFLTVGKKYLVEDFRAGRGNWLYIRNDRYNKHTYSAKHFKWE